MGTSCISKNHIEDKENRHPARKQASQLEIALEPSNSIKSTDTSHRKSPTNPPPAAKHPPSSLTCTLCQESFNRLSRLPVMLCEEEHTICKTCKDMLLATTVQRYRVCPWCKRIINEQFVRTNEQRLSQLAC